MQEMSTSIDDDKANSTEEDVNSPSLLSKIDRNMFPSYLNMVQLTEYLKRAAIFKSEKLYYSHKQAAILLPNKIFFLKSLFSDQRMIFWAH